MPSTGGYGISRARVENVLLWRAAMKGSGLRTRASRFSKLGGGILDRGFVEATA